MEEETLIEYFEVNDGEIFGIQQVSIETGEVLDQILMERQVALDMACDILHMIGENHAILPSTK
jgi:hypothetical protein